MAQAGSMTARRMHGILTGAGGLAQGLAAVAAAEGFEPAPVGIEQVTAQNVAAEISERAGGARYPALQVYCDRAQNLLTEKFRKFSGRVRLVVEVRVSQDRLQGIERQLQLYVDAVTDVLERHRGDWGDGMHYPGSYEVTYAAVRHGGKNYLQTAKVTFEVNVSVN